VILKPVCWYKPVPRLIIILAVLLFSFLSHPAAHAGQKFNIAIDIGHSRDSGGALSARNRPEYAYNLKMGLTLLRELNKDPLLRAFIVNPEGRTISLEQRVDLINGARPDFLISIHHDSVQPVFLSEWSYRGTPATYCDKYRGYSIFISERNAQPKLSRSYAIAIGKQLRKSGFFPSAHHAEMVEGEGRQQIDSKTGVYRYDGLVVLQKSHCPAVLLECGIIKNRAEELLLRNPAYRKRLARAIRSAVREIMHNR
jgi:N-acetylmuramoyl-L-alanine amidase